MRRSDVRTIVVDASDIHEPSGGRTAVLELFRAVFEREQNWRFVALVSRLEPDWERFEHVRQVLVPFRNRWLERLWIQAAVMYLAWVRRVDLVHFARTMGGLTWPARNVLTVFDVTTLRYPQLHSRTAVWFWRRVQPVLVRQANLVITISQDVANDVIREFNVPSSRTEVVYCAPKAIFSQPVAPDAIDRVRRAYGLPDRYILFVGMLAKKKNLITLIRALRLMRDRGIDCPPLILAGRRYRQSDDSAILAEIQALGLDSCVRYIGPVLDSELPGLYRGAQVFIFPSLHEGFGIPCVEAMACGVPVVAARSGAVPEIVADAALLVDDPLDVGGFAEAIATVLNNPSLRRELEARGLLRAKQFSWPRLADQVLALYRRLLEG